MESAKANPHCDYRPQDDYPYTLTNLVQISEQVNSLNNHIRDLFKIRSNLLHRSNQLRSLASTLPPEILSNIFRKLVDPDFALGEPSAPFRLRQSFTLSSVSTHWRNAALGTPQLWEDMHCIVPNNNQSVDNLISLLQHCSSCAHTLNILLSLPSFENDREVLHTLTQELFSSEIKEKVRSLTLCWPPAHWLSMIFRLPILRSLFILGYVASDRDNFRLYTLATVPTSLRSLHVEDVPMFDTPILRLCQNVEFCKYRPGSPIVPVSYSEPLILGKLERLIMPAGHGLQTVTSAGNLLMPSLKHLELEHRGFHDLDFYPDIIIHFCRQVSKTLLGLTIRCSGPQWSVDALRLLFKSLPHLREFHAEGWIVAPINVIQALISYKDSNREIDCLPRLTTLSLHEEPNDGGSLPSRSYFDLVLELLKCRRTNEGPLFHVDIAGRSLIGLGPELEEELKSVVENYQILVTNRKQKLPWL
ncbi:hypothetical protein Agabi119p4_11753 [Agaricus bisporus var. burnettii]|uniref:F-box domain-containing protein n=1 Tax=Agaricus bisporus var. burnettii TaxID=192524 RepID=A0A8H7EV64_AGABI|nr:hypothetical protein Agabi119p4_11753 [Agaricus bisporus var. burnettii]